MVYVQDHNGHPLMPTVRYGKVRRLLKEGNATVVCKCPFTVRLTYKSTTYVQDVHLGVDAGSKHIGISATTEVKEIYASEIQLRTDITELLSARRELRRARRSRKTRYRKARFDNRTHAKQKGWLAPTVEQKTGTHLTVIRKICEILPVREITVETAQFDMQLLKAIEKELPLPEGAGYQQGEQLGFWNTREYVLYRDGHTCQCCKGKSKDPVLNVHHVESRMTGGDSPDNLVTLCEYCHKQYHLGKISLPSTVRRQSKSLRDAAFMGIMRWTLYNRLKEQFEGTGVNVRNTYGYLTKNIRIQCGLEKAHCTDARVISGHPLADPAEECFFQKKVRCHNRQIHKLTILPGGIRKKNQAAHEVQGFRLFDKVRIGDREGFIFGRRASGYFDVRTLDGEKLSAGVSWKKCRLVKTAKHLLTERRNRAFLPQPAEVGVYCADI